MSSVETDPQYVEQDAAATLASVRAYLPRFTPTLEIGKFGWWGFQLPVPPQAEYQFSLGGIFGGERHIGARQVPVPRDQRPRFWYSPFELAAFRDNASELETVFFRSVEVIMNCRTRITESRGIFFLTFKAQYEADGSWQGLPGGVSYLGLGLGIPLVGKKRSYTSPAVASYNV